MTDTRVYIAETTALKDEAVFNRLYSSVPAYRQKKIDRFRFEKDKRLSLGVALLLKRACEDFGIAGADEHVECSERGKPYFVDYPQIHFNLSHSDERVMCAISTYEVGCDVEIIKKDRLHIAEKAFSPSEQAWIKSLGNALEQDKGFYRIWTLKECYMKVTGLGFELIPSDFALHMDDSRILLNHNGLRPEYVFREFDFNDGYKYACCLRDAPVGCVIDVVKGYTDE